MGSQQLILFSRNGGHFQIDENCGFTASLVDKFLQTHAGVVHIVQSIPPSLPHESFTGWIAHGGFKIDRRWRDWAVVEARIKSLLGNPLKLRVGDGMKFTIDDVLQSNNSAIVTVTNQTLIITVL
ncbi:hypothetical protein GGS21DRAFT_345113 [Xylaria nigripes]|nr:hypothetical protein GGS21DRAFT_345113 [Xylaria nigripes]